MLSATFASDQSTEGALQLLNLSTKEVAGNTKRVATVAKTSPDELGSSSKSLANSIVNVNTAAKVWHSLPRFGVLYPLRSLPLALCNFFLVCASLLLFFLFTSSVIDVIIARCWLPRCNLTNKCKRTF